MTFFVGENGSGKSTLLEAIAIAAGFNPEGGSRNFRFATRPTEPELHGQLSALSIIHRLLGTGSQFVMATHSPILLAYPGALIYRLDDSGIAPTSYEETEHYAITRSFLQNPARYFKNLFEEE